MSDQKQLDYVTLNTGAQMPLVGLGTWKIPKDVAPATVQQAIESGYRLLDCACDYGNEVEVGQGIAAAIEGGVDRKDIFVTSKLWNTYHEAKYVQQACQKTLDDLGLEYLDLYLIHFPIAQTFVPFEKSYPPEWRTPENPDATTFSNATIQETWGAMEALVSAGLVKNIGICNFSASLLMQLTNFAKIQPAVLQVERHPYLSQPKLVQYATSKGIKLTAFSSFGGASYIELGFNTPNFVHLLDHPTVTAIATELNKTAGQVLLKWSTQGGVAVIPKTSKQSRLVSNADLFTWSLTDANVAALNALNSGMRFNDPADFCVPSCPIYD